MIHGEKAPLICCLASTSVLGGSMLLNEYHKSVGRIPSGTSLMFTLSGAVLAVLAYREPRIAHISLQQHWVGCGVLCSLISIIYYRRSSEESTPSSQSMWYTICGTSLVLCSLATASRYVTIGSYTSILCTVETVLNARGNYEIDCPFHCYR